MLRCPWGASLPVLRASGDCGTGASPGRLASGRGNPEKETGLPRPPDFLPHPPVRIARGLPVTPCVPHAHFCALPGPRGPFSGTDPKDLLHHPDCADPGEARLRPHEPHDPPIRSLPPRSQRRAPGGRCQHRRTPVPRRRSCPYPPRRRPAHPAHVTLTLSATFNRSVNAATGRRPIPRATCREPVSYALWPWACPSATAGQSTGPPSPTAVAEHRTDLDGPCSATRRPS